MSSCDRAVLSQFSAPCRPSLAIQESTLVRKAKGRQERRRSTSEAGVILADYPALSVNRAGGGNPLYAEDTPNQEFLIWCAPIQEFLIRCTPIQEFEFTDSVLVFVRGVIWHQEGYYCYIISQMNTFIINKILPRKCLPLLTACRHL